MNPILLEIAIVYGNERGSRCVLNEFKLLIKSGAFYPVSREKNNQALISLGLTLKNQKDELLALTHENYSSGPSRDLDRPGYIWVFGKQVFQTEVYIKLKVAMRGSKKQGLCISFHPADYPVIYPLR